MPLTPASAELSRRTARAAFFGELRNPTGAQAYAYPDLSSEFPSDQDQETYPWLGQVPQLREWLGSREIKSLPPQSFAIRNRKWEATISIDNDLIRRDKLGQVATRSRDMARRASSHRELLFWDTILLGASTNCYDAQFYFDTDHNDPTASVPIASGQSNKITVSGVTTPTAPTVANFENGYEQAVNALRDFKDDQGQPWNFSEDLHVWVPTNMAKVARIALGSGANATAADTSGGTGAFRGEATPHVSAFIRARQTALGQTVGTSFWLFNRSPEVKPIIYQVEREAEFETLGVGSDHGFKTDTTLYGVNGSYNMGYGPWQHAVQVTFTT